MTLSSSPAESEVPRNSSLPSCYRAAPTVTASSLSLSGSPAQREITHNQPPSALIPAALRSGSSPTTPEAASSLPAPAIKQLSQQANNRLLPYSSIMQLRVSWAAEAPSENSPLPPSTSTPAETAHILPLSIEQPLAVEDPKKQPPEAASSLLHLSGAAPRSGSSLETPSSLPQSRSPEYPSMCKAGLLIRIVCRPAAGWPAARQSSLARSRLHQQELACGQLEPAYLRRAYAPSQYCDEPDARGFLPPCPLLPAPSSRRVLAPSGPCQVFHLEVA